jgi:hypothetical protein
MLMIRPCFLREKSQSNPFAPWLAREGLENEPFNHARKDCVGDVYGAVDIYLDYVVDFVFWGFREIYRHRVGLANIVD